MQTDTLQPNSATIDQLAAASRSTVAWRRLIGIPPWLLGLSVVAVVIVVLPVLISLVQAFQGGPVAALNAIKATSATNCSWFFGSIVALAGTYICSVRYSSQERALVRSSATCLPICIRDCL